MEPDQAPIKLHFLGIIGLFLSEDFTSQKFCYCLANLRQSTVGSFQDEKKYCRLPIGTGTWRSSDAACDSQIVKLPLLVNDDDSATSMGSP